MDCFVLGKKWVESVNSGGAEKTRLATDRSGGQDKKNKKAFCCSSWPLSEVIVGAS